MTSPHTPRFCIEHVCFDDNSRDYTHTLGLVRHRLPELRVDAAGITASRWRLPADARSAIVEEVARQLLAGYLNLDGSLWFHLPLTSRRTERRGGHRITSLVSITLAPTVPKPGSDPSAALLWQAHDDPGPGRETPWPSTLTAFQSALASLTPSHSGSLGSASLNDPTQLLTVDQMRELRLPEATATTLRELMNLWGAGDATSPQTVSAPEASPDWGPWPHAVAAMAWRLLHADEETITRAQYAMTNPHCAIGLDELSDRLWALGHQTCRPVALHEIHQLALCVAAVHQRPDSAYVAANPHAHPEGQLAEETAGALAQLFTVTLAAVCLLDHLDRPTLGAAVGPWLWRDQPPLLALLQPPPDPDASRNTPAAGHPVLEPPPAATFGEFRRLLSLDLAHSPLSPQQTLGDLAALLEDPDPTWRAWTLMGTVAWVACEVNTEGVLGFVEWLHSPDTVPVVSPDNQPPSHDTPSEGGTSEELRSLAEALMTFVGMRHVRDRPGSLGSATPVWAGSSGGDGRWKDRVALRCAGYPHVTRWLLA